MSEIRAGRPNPDGAVHKLDTSDNCVLSFLRGEQVAIAGFVAPDHRRHAFYGLALQLLRWHAQSFGHGATLATPISSVRSGCTIAAPARLTYSLPMTEIGPIERTAQSKPAL